MCGGEEGGGGVGVGSQAPTAPGSGTGSGCGCGCVGLCTCQVPLWKPEAPVPGKGLDLEVDFIKEV